MTSETNGMSNSDINRLKINETKSDDDLKFLEHLQTLIPEMKRHFSIISDEFNRFLIYAKRIDQLASDYRALKTKQEQLEEELQQRKADEKNIEKHLEVNAESRVYLDVGGQRFTTTIKTLVQQSNSLFFKTLIYEKWNKTANSVDEPIFIDRDGRLFDYILKYLRTGELNIEEKTTRRELLIEAKFYKLSALENELNSLGKKEDLPAINGNFSEIINQSPPISPAPKVIQTRVTPFSSTLSTSARTWTPTSNPSSSTKLKPHPAQTASSWRSNPINETRLNVFTGSMLLTTEYEDKLLEFIGSVLPSYEKTWQLIYRASEQGYEAVDFHRCCDDQAPTISIILTDYGNIFGGYTTVPWSSAMQRADQADPTAFLFTLKNSLNVPPTKFPVATEFQHCAISHNPTCGPNFGSPNNEGSDLCLRGRFNEKTNCIFFPKSYPDSTNYCALIFAKKDFACKEVEVLPLMDNN